MTSHDHQQALKVFVWFAQTPPTDYGQAGPWVKIYAVAENEMKARQMLDGLLPKNGLQAGLFRMALANTRPVVFASPFAEVNISDGYKAASFIAGQKLV